MENIFLIGREDLRDELKELFAEILKDADKRAEEKAKDRLLTADEVCEILKISATTIWRWQKSEYLLPVFIGGKKRYRKTDIQRIMEKGEEL
jgi:predicted DNA-binding transcriptional regulator AlpA